MSNVLIVDGNSQYTKMYESRGWTVVSKIAEADLVQFTGGADVSPSYYGAEPHHTTYSDASRDAFEKAIFERCADLALPMVGICRGGQFLNVMSGGSMWQDVDNHAIHGTHMMFDVITGAVVNVSSTHHQMMRPASSGQVIAVASESSRRENIFAINGTFPDDVEVVFYRNTMSLCFQPHPEYPGFEACQDYFFELLQRTFQL